MKGSQAYGKLKVKMVSQLVGCTPFPNSKDKQESAGYKAVMDELMANTKLEAKYKEERMKEENPNTFNAIKKRNSKATPNEFNAQIESDGRGGYKVSGNGTVFWETIAKVVYRS